MNIQSLVRPNISKLKPYSSARSLYTSGVLMDANENPHNVFGSNIELNRYPDSSNKAIRAKLAQINGVLQEQVAVGNGSDELIDLLIRIFCEPGQDNILITSPTYGMYEVSANINNAGIKDIHLIDNNLDVKAIDEAIDSNTKIIFLCSPNNPTGDVLNTNDILYLIKNTNAIVCVDEAYADFMTTDSLQAHIDQHPNLVVLRTLSKAYGMAGVRLGYILADKELVALIQKVKPPYNVNALTTDAVLNALADQDKVKSVISELISERNRIAKELETINTIRKIYSSQSNFLLFKIDNADEVFKKLVAQGIIIRSRTGMAGLADCLRVSIGTKEQNDLFLEKLKLVVSN